MTAVPRKEIWFKNRLYGYGWRPASWKGWACVAVYFAFVVFVLSTIRPTGYTVGELRLSMFSIFSATALLVFVAYKTGERPEWRWGGKKVNFIIRPSSRSSPRSRRGRSRAAGST